MQAFVPKSALNSSPSEIVGVVAFYDDNVNVDIDSHGPGMTLFSVPPAALNNTSGQIPTLVQNWRNLYQPQILGGEATRRINAVFPDYSQRNSNSEINGYIVQYGADSSQWPTYQQNRKAEIDRCWAYVNEVRAKANAMAEMQLPNDPTADANWPTVISPYVPS